MHIVNFTIQQSTLQDQSEILDEDITKLQQQLAEVSSQQMQAAEREDFQTADQLDLQLSQITALIQLKQSQSRKLNEDVLTLESRKCDKQQELLKVITSSLDKLSELSDTQVKEKLQYEETETLAISEKKKRLHYEKIRLAED